MFRKFENGPRFVRVGLHGVRVGLSIRVEFNGIVFNVNVRLWRTIIARWANYNGYILCVANRFGSQGLVAPVVRQLR